MLVMVTRVIGDVASQGPQRLKMSYEEYLEIAGNARIVEWVDGESIIYMPPTPQHQIIFRFLNNLLDSFVQFFNLGDVYAAPLEVKLWPDGPSREPDIFFVTTENQIIKLTDKRFEGAPDLIIEIIWPGSVTEDRVRKFSQYEQAGVKEYWIIDPRPHQQQVDFYSLGEDNLYHAAPLGDEGRFHSTVIPNFWLNIDWLWADPLPNPQLVLAEIMISIEDLPTDVKAAYQALYKILLRQKTSVPPKLV
jgi:Uma2 family endonuclease